MTDQINTFSEVINQGLDQICTNINDSYLNVIIDNTNKAISDIRAKIDELERRIKDCEDKIAALG